MRDLGPAGAGCSFDMEPCLRMAHQLAEERRERLAAEGQASDQDAGEPHIPDGFSLRTGWEGRVLVTPTGLVMIET